MIGHSKVDVFDRLVFYKQQMDILFFKDVLFW